MIIIPLSKPVQVHGSSVSEVELKDPTLEQIQRFGLPASMDGGGNFTVNAQVAVKYIPELAGIPPSSLNHLTPFDINNLCWAIWRFFMIPPTPEQTNPEATE
ncbi:phage tail assembly protein [Dryocola sp. LX212]